MRSYHWAKIWIEILDDAKMGVLSDHLWRRTIELILVAKEVDKEGYLPPLTDMAWRLRTNPELLEAELTDLANIGIIERRNGGWFVTNFAKRQGKMTAAERKARQREREKQLEQQGHIPVTSESHDGHDIVTNRDIEDQEDQDIKIREDKIRSFVTVRDKANHKTMLPPHLHIGSLPESWDRWLQYHEERGRPITVATALAQFKKFEQLGPEQSAAAIENSISNNYTGLVEPRTPSNNGQIEPAGFAAGRRIQEELANGNA